MENSADWIFPKNFIVNPQGGNVNESEAAKNRSDRSKTIWFMEDMARELNMDRRVLYTASVYFHRFYLFHSFQKQNRFHLAVACLFLGGKVEERAYKLKELVLCYYNLRFQRKANDLEFQRTYKDIIVAERMLLHTLNFDLTITHPYFICLNKMRDLRNYVPEDSRKSLMQAALNFLNDSYRSTFCLEYTPTEIAVAVLYMATIALSVRPVNPNSRSLVELSWISLLDKDIREYRLRCICLEILDMYEQLAFVLRESEDVKLRLQRQQVASQLVAEMGGIVPAHLSIAVHQTQKRDDQNVNQSMMVDDDHTTLDGITPREKSFSFATVAGDSHTIAADYGCTPTHLRVAPDSGRKDGLSSGHHQKVMDESFNVLSRQSSGDDEYINGTSHSINRRPNVTVTKVVTSSSSSHHHTTNSLYPLQTPSSVTGMNDSLPRGDLSAVSYMSASVDDMHGMMVSGGYAVHADDTPIFFNNTYQHHHHETASDTPKFSDLAAVVGSSSGNNSAIKSGIGRSSGGGGRQRSRSNSFTEYAEYSKRIRSE